MNEYVTCKQMKQLEEKADAAGLSYYTMMENAGKAVADVIIDKSGITTGKKLRFSAAKATMAVTVL